MRYSLLAVLLSGVLCGCGTSEPDTLATQPPPAKPAYDEKEMEAAVARAKGEVNTFIAELTNPTGTDHAVKIRVEENGQSEYLWLSKVSFKDGEFTGTVDNEPQQVKEVAMGQQLTVKRDEIYDWMFKRNGESVGNFARPILLRTRNNTNHPVMPGMIGG